MAQHKDNSKLQGSAKGIRGKPEVGPSPVPKMEPRGSGKELHIHDLEDGSRWKIKDETIVELIKKHHAAPDQKTKDEILKILQSKVATSSSASGLESKISAELQKLKLKSDSKADKRTK